MSGMNPSATAASVLLIVGAAVGLIPTYVMERRKERHALAVRWDAPLYDLCKECAASARQLVHLSRRLDRVADRDEQSLKLDDELARLRSVVQQMRILGTAELQQSAMEVEHHAWWVRAVYEGRSDEYIDHYGGRAVEDRLRDAMRKLLVAARRQLGVKNPGNVVPDDPIRPPNQLPD
ncbi:hypothetical protein [Catenulispora rubra]|uniref:hypothetical protein n=1 Tax=Catenulispora rubra TaxID=280293 RepID=UPI00189237EC|nr:hypothetical protein [Catenulispora rubra]